MYPAKQLRADLRAAFPTTTFRVWCSHGTTYEVQWTDGPTVARVKEITAGYETKGFDGMTDCQYYTPGQDSLGRPSKIGYIFERRTLSAAFVARLIQAVAEYWGGVDGPLPRPEEYQTGHLCSRYPRPDMAHHGCDWQTLISRAAEDRSTVTRDDQ